jgi:hypothetical protein
MFLPIECLDNINLRLLILKFIEVIFKIVMPTLQKEIASTLNRPLGYVLGK